MIYKDFKFRYSGEKNIEGVSKKKPFIQKGETAQGSKLRLLRSIFSGALESELNRTVLEGAESVDTDDLLMKLYGNEFTIEE